MHCCICYHSGDVVKPATAIYDGYSMCDQHQTDVFNKADYVWFDTAGHFQLRATVGDLLSRTHS